MARRIKKNGIVYGGAIRIYSHVTTLFIIQHHGKWIYAKHSFCYPNHKCHCFWYARRNDRSKYIIRLSDKKWKETDKCNPSFFLYKTKMQKTCEIIEKNTKKCVKNN